MQRVIASLRAQLDGAPRSGATAAQMALHAAAKALGDGGDAAQAAALAMLALEGGNDACEWVDPLDGTSALWWACVHRAEALALELAARATARVANRKGGDNAVTPLWLASFENMPIVATRLLEIEGLSIDDKAEYVLFCFVLSFVLSSSHSHCATLLPPLPSPRHVVPDRMEQRR